MIDASRDLFRADSLPLFQVLRRIEYRRLRGCVRRSAHTKTGGREDTLGETATTKSRAVQDKCSVAGSKRSRQQQRGFARESARVYEYSCAVIGNSALRDGISKSLFSTHLPCYNWRPKRVGTRTPSTSSVQENPIRVGRIGTGNFGWRFYGKYT